MGPLGPLKPWDGGSLPPSVDILRCSQQCDVLTDICCLNTVPGGMAHVCPLPTPSVSMAHSRCFISALRMNGWTTWAPVDPLLPEDRPRFDLCPTLPVNSSGSKRNEEPWGRHPGPQPRGLSAGLEAPHSAWPPTTPAGTQHAIITVLLPGSGNEGCRVPAVITAWLKRTGAASKPNYKVCSRTPSCPAPFLWGLLEGGMESLGRSQPGLGLRFQHSRERRRAESLGLRCFESLLKYPPTHRPIKISRQS